MKLFIHILLAFFFVSETSFAQDIIVHDPVMIQQNDSYYVFCTGMGISVWSSTDMKNWKAEKSVFKDAPDWTKEAVKDFKGHMWAPDIAYFNNKYYLYYSVSSFGKNTSCIGLATNVTLDINDPDFKWEDHGMVIQSVPGKTNWNAIDPNLIVDKDGTPYLTFGSFWDGLKLVKLTPDAMTVAEDITKIPTIASRKKPVSSSNQTVSVEAGPNAIEAPFVFKKGDFYYLFASIDYCCRGVDSSYKMIVGRSKTIQGPYLDKKGKDMATGGGNIVLEGDENWHGVGHNSAYTFNSKDYLVFHGYDANDEGRPKLLIKQMNWDNDGWPLIKARE